MARTGGASQPAFRFFLLVLSTAALAADAFAGSRVASTREDDPVLVLGSALPDFQGTLVSNLYLFRWNAGTSAFEPVPYQIDQRVVHTFTPGQPTEVQETIYDVLHEDDGVFDANDELAFLYRDTGPQAPQGAVGPLGSGGEWYEIQVSDPRPGSTTPAGWVYVFTGVSLPVSSVSYVTWAGSASSAISNPYSDLGFLDKWLLTGYSVRTPCGAGTDLIDRIKGRAGIAVDRAESEEVWNSASTYLGGLVGPIRAIRYVLGAASGINTTHHDIAYRGFLDLRVALRVHAISDVWLYVDMLPRAGTTFRSELLTTPVSVDGLPDAVPLAPPKWTIVRGPDGGIATMYDVPPSPFVLTPQYFYKDDATFNDKPLLQPTYGDQDDAAYGVHGINLHGVTGDYTDTILATFRLYPLCSNEGDDALGTELRSRYDAPLVASATPKWTTLGAVATLVLTRNNMDLVLTWPPVAGAQSYRVYTASSPSTPPGSWTLASSPSSLSWIDSGAMSNPQTRYYTVTAFGPGGEGPR